MCKHTTWDELLAYPTIKIVKVKDRYLGGIRYLMMLLIFAYIIGYVIVYNSGYNTCIVPNGSINLSLQKPDGFIYPKSYNYCSQNPNANASISDPLPCQVVDERDVYQPVDQTSAMYITTRFSQTFQERNPNCTDGSPCQYPWIAAPNTTQMNKTYSAGIGAFTIRFSHFFQARQFYLETRNDYYSQSCAEMNGKLENYNGDVIAHYGNDGLDIINVSTILRAAGVDLNEIQTYPPDRNQSESNRHAGIVLFFGIDYSGVYNNEVKYTYTVTQVPKTEYKVTRSTMIDFGRRVIIDTHGVKIFFVFSGNICRFDFQTMLINMVAGLGLLSVATLTTDIMMQYVMPLRTAYVRYKYKETEHHDALRKRLSKKKLGTLEISESSVNQMCTSANRSSNYKSPQSNHYTALDGGCEDNNDNAIQS